MKRSLLVVDDEAEIRSLLQRHFRYLGWQVEVAEDGLAALDVLAIQRTDIVISDVRMPRMDGVTLLENIRRDYPMIRVIMITGYVNQESILACMRQGAETCVFKPLEDLIQLEEAVDNAMKTIKHWWVILADLQSMREQGEGRASATLPNDSSRHHPSSWPQPGALT
ncbi:MAG: response regulator [Polyangiales bacterium]